MRALRVILVVLLALVLLALSLPFTETGSRRVIAWLDSATPLQVDYKGGSLLGGLQLHRIALELDDVDLEFVDLAINVDSKCLWVSEFCFDVALGGGTVRWAGGEWSQEALQARGVATQEAILVADARLAAGRLQLAPSAETGPEGFEPPPVELPLRLHIDSLKAARVDIDAGEFSQRLREIALAGNWEGADVSVRSLALAADGWGAVAVSGTAQLQDEWPLALDVEVSRVDAELPEPVDLRSASLQLAGTLADLHLDASTEGAPRVALAARTDVTAQGIPYSGTWSIDWGQGVPLVDIVPAAAGSGMVMEGPLTGSSEGELLGAQTAQFSALLAGQGYSALLARGALRWQAPTLTLGELTLSDAASASELSLTADLELAERWSVDGKLSSKGISLPAQAPQGRLNGELDFRASGEGDAWDLALTAIDLEGELEGLPARVQGAAGLDSALQLQPGQLEVLLNGTELQLDVSQSLATLSLTLDSLGRWVPETRGRVELTASGSPALDSLTIAGAASGVLVQGTDIGGVRIDGRYATDSETFSLTLEAPDIERDERQFGLSVNASGSLASHRFTLTTRGELAGTLQLDGSLQAGQWQGQLEPAQLVTSAGTWTLGEAVPLAWRSQARQLSVSPHCWRHEYFELCGNRLLLGDSGELKLALAGDMRALEVVLPRGMRARGAVNGNLDASWSATGTPALALHLLGEDLRIVRRYGMGERVQAEYERIKLSAQRGDDGYLALNGQVRRGGRQVASLSGTLPPASEGDLDLALDIDALQLVSFAPWFPEVSSLEGEVSGRVGVSGPVTAPVVDGELRLAQGRLVVVGNPTELTDMAVQIKLRNGGGDITGRGMLGGGELTFAGPVSVQPTLSMKLQVTGGRHTVLIPPASELVVSETLELSFADRTMRVSGDVTVHEGVLRHEELPAGSVAISDDVVIVDVAGNVLETERPIALSADVWLRIRDRFRVEGETIQAVLGGDLRLVQTPTAPLQVFGTLNLLGGELRAYQQTLQIQRGSIAFSGPPDNPELDVRAEREIRSDDVTVGARLGGSLENVELEVYSDPVMSQSEAMSYLVRGRGLDAGAGADGTALALAVGADVVNRSGIVSELNRMPMISDVAFGSSGSDDDTAATVSGYIGNRIYVSYGIGIYEPINVFTARLYLQSRLWLEVVSRLESSVDLYYSFDID